MIEERHARWTGFEPRTLRERFLKVIAGAGYTKPEVIAEQYHPKYMSDVVAYDKMLQEYEQAQNEQRAYLDQHHVEASEVG